MRNTHAFLILIALAMVLAAGISPRAEKWAAQSQHFERLGDLDGGIFESLAADVSADGSTVVGCSNSDKGMEAFRWTRRDGIVGLGFPQAYGLSADGSTVVGYCHRGSNEVEPVCWTRRSGLQGLGNLVELGIGSAQAASADGSVIVGWCEHPMERGRVAFHWTRNRGMAALESPPDADCLTEVHDVSSDGTVMVGVMRHESDPPLAFRWSSLSGYVGLGVLPGDTDSMARAVSADGLVVVGESESLGVEAFRWTQQTGMVGLGALPGGSRASRAFAVSGNGSIIVGQSHGESGLEAFIWDAAHGMRSLRRLLSDETDAGATLRGWKLISATGLSYDGSVVVGFGVNPSGKREAWVARLGKASSTEAPASSVALRMTNTH
jgi:probable HAF family extracellular repeat protein